MIETNINESEKARRRRIGSIGTVARVLIGSLMVSYGLTGGRIEVMHGNVQTGFDPLSVGIGVVAYPALLLAWQWIRARTTKTRLEATGPLVTTINIAVFIGLVLTPRYAPPLSFTSNAALVFYGPRCCWRPRAVTEAARCSPYPIGSCAGMTRSAASCSVRSTTTSAA